MNISKMNSNIIFGIDLGTTNSCCSVWINKTLHVIKEKINGKSYSLIPSVAYINDDQIIVGNNALNKNPILTFNNSKRLIGRNFNDNSVSTFQKFLSYNITSNLNGNILISTKKGLKKPEEISAMILAKIKLLAMDFANIKDGTINAIITIPAYFNDSQRRATQDAAKIAGINCIRMINEPTAAALSYGILGKKTDTERNIIVYDFGGGTLDVSLLNIDEGIFEVIATTGDSYLGGEDFTQELFNYIVNSFKNKLNMDSDEKLKIHYEKLKDLKNLCENAKIKLSKIEETNIFIQNFWGTNNLNITINRHKFQEICKDLLERAMKPILDIMNNDEIKMEDITDVLLVGGTTNIPVIQFMLHNYFNIKPTLSTNPDYIVSAGAAIQGYMLNNQSDPFCQDIVLVDVIPLSLGIETLNGVFSPIIERNSCIPIKITKKFTTDSDNENEINIKIYEGERKLVKDNFLIGNFLLKGIEKAKKGVPVIEITFSVDVNGIINVSAKDIRSESESTITIDNSVNKLSKDQLDKLIVEAEEYQKEDFMKQTKIERLNELNEIKDMILYNLNLKETKLNENDKNLIFDELKEIYSLIDNYDNQDLLHIINKLKRKFSSLILKLDNDTESDIKFLDKTEMMFSDLDLDTNSTSIPCSKSGFINEDENKSKDNLIELCNEVLKNLDKKLDKEFINYIHNIIIWSNVTLHLNDEDYFMKIEEIKINYDKYNTVEQVIDYKDELINLCNTLLLDIKRGELPMAEIFCNNLKEYINKLLDWANQSKYPNNDENYKTQLERLNIKCEELYELSQH